MQTLTPAQIQYRDRLVGHGLSLHDATTTASSTKIRSDSQITRAHNLKVTKHDDVANTTAKDAPKKLRNLTIQKTPLPTPLSEKKKLQIEDAISTEAEDARKACAIGYMARTLAQATLPHSDPKTPRGQMYTRDTGLLTLSIVPTSPRFGIPFGSIPRVLLAWICTEAVQKKERTLSLGRSQTEFLGKLQLHNNGRDISRLKEQSMRLIRSVISVEYGDNAKELHSSRLMLTSQDHVFWHPRNMDVPSLWDSTLELTQDFYDEILKSPVPLNLTALNSLTRSPLAMDIYTWLVYRIFVLKRSGRPFVMIPWAALKEQFGSDYADTEKGLKDFKYNFKLRLKDVLVFYPEAVHSIEDIKSSGCMKLKDCALQVPRF